MKRKLSLIKMILIISSIIIILWSLIPILTTGIPPKDKDILDYLNENKNIEITRNQYSTTLFNIGDKLSISKLPFITRLIFPYYSMEFGPIPRWYKSYKIIKKYDIDSRHKIKNNRDKLGIK